jgi:prevent-host-death family protein
MMSKLDKIDNGEHMRYISASDAKQRLAAVLDAAQREPITIRRQNREVAVVISPEDYRRLKGVNVEEFQRFCDRVSAGAANKGLTEERLNHLLHE